MDKKEKLLLDYYYQRFQENCFDEKDVYAFLILIRRQAKGFQSINELADFIAHRDKDKGGIKNYLEDVKYKLSNLGRINATITIKPAFTFKEIKTAINKILMNNGYTKLSDETNNHILLCIISILQDVKILDKGKEIGRLRFGITKKKIMLNGEIEIEHSNRGTVSLVRVVFVVLEAKNCYVQSHNLDDNPHMPNEIIEVINKEGNFDLILKEVAEL
ncbi:hypothetical protein COD95_04425 [Bacillus thuringiensis]|uniref:hypothetical protein n=1 Tax=Bacillus thuringiensis TaxID=1428 RepID=UPI000BFBF9F2|nr:hypothetical protein [Bacillus thuringiensis]PGW26761.1 hypothetical protein COD95_04425 [Bacillus thuringiensis]